MDIGKVAHCMKEFDKILKRGHKLGPQNRDTYEMMRSAKTLDRVDVSVLVSIPTHDGAFEWEKYEGIQSFEEGDTGSLTVRVNGFDADGDLGTVKFVLYPAGRWVKVEASVTNVPNPYYVDPDQPDPADLPPAGF